MTTMITCHQYQWIFLWWPMTMMQERPTQEPVAHLCSPDLVPSILLILPWVPGNIQGGHHHHCCHHHRHHHHHWRHQHHHHHQRLVDACSSSNSRWRVGGRGARGSDSVWAVLTGEVIVMIMIIMIGGRGQFHYYHNNHSLTMVHHGEHWTLATINSFCIIELFKISWETNLTTMHGCHL